MALRPCLVCGAPAKGSRCPAHQVRAERPRGPRPYTRTHERITRQTIARWVAAHGWVCPGWRRPPHPVPPGGLSGEHIIPVALRPDLAHDPANYTVLCGICNSAKGARVD